MRKTISFFSMATIICFLFNGLYYQNIQAKTALTSEYVNDTIQNIMLRINLSPKDFILKESIDISVDHPAITLSPWKADKNAIERYEATFKDTKKVFEGDVSLSLQATSNKPYAEIQNARLYISYYLGSQKRTVQEVLPLKVKPPAVTISKTPSIVYTKRLPSQKKKNP